MTKRAADLKRGEQEFRAECIKSIRENILSRGKSSLEFGNTMLVAIGNGVYVSVNHNELVKLDSEDGWDKTEDIANWADIVQDVVNCYAAGNKQYSMVWNTK